MKALLTTVSLFILAISSSVTAAESVTLRCGHFPNVTHAQGVIAHGLSREGKGWFEQRLGPNVKIQWFTYNAGPSAMEAIFAGSLDLTYVGQGPALNAYFKSQGQEIRVISGAATGGAALVVHPGDTIRSAVDFRGKTIATPQLGNTQDISCRAWLKDKGFHVTLIGGDVKVLPINNPDQLGAFQQKQVDAVWTVEPWVTRLLREAKGRIFFDDQEVQTTWLACSARFLAEHADLARKIAAANEELTQWLKSNPTEAQRILGAELKEETRAAIPPEAISQAWQRINFTTAVSPRLIAKAVQDAREAGFLKETTDISKLLVRP